MTTTRYPNVTLRILAALPAIRRAVRHYCHVRDEPLPRDERALLEDGLAFIRGIERRAREARGQ